MLDKRKPFHKRAEQGTDSVAWKLDLKFRTRLCELVDREMNEIHKRRHDPEDVVQSVLMSFYVRTANGEYSFKHTGAMWNLLKQVARRKILKRIEKDNAVKRDIRKEEKADEEGLPNQVPTHAQARLFGEALEMALNGLDSPTPEILRMQLYGYTVAEIMEKVLQGLASPDPEILSKRLQGKSEREIATEIGSTREAVRYKLKRICDRLRKLIAEAETR